MRAYMHHSKRHIASHQASRQSGSERPRKLGNKNLLLEAVQSRQGVPSFASCGHGRVPVRFRITGCSIRVRHFKSPQEKKEKDVCLRGQSGG